MQHSISNCLCISTLPEVEVTCTPLVFVMSALYIVPYIFQLLVLPCAVLQLLTCTDAVIFYMKAEHLEPEHQ